MKFNLILAAICLALGATVAWVAKPDPTAQAEKQDEGKTASKKTSPSSSPEKREVSERTIVESDRDLKEAGAPLESDEIEKTVNEMQNRMVKMIEKRLMAKMDAKISKLVAQLNLTPEQEASLRKAAKEKSGKVEDLLSGNIAPSQLNDMRKEDGIKEALADILTPEQKEQYDEVQKRELANKVEAKALQGLAKLSNLDLSQEQKDAAYDILYKQAETTVTSTEESGATGMISMITEGMGIQLDSYALGISSSFVPNPADIVNGEIEQPDPQKIMAQAEERRTEQIEQKVEALRPVLNENQLSQYRKDLEIKSGGIFGGMLGGFEQSDRIGE